jgi:hypothetical protein
MKLPREILESIARLGSLNLAYIIRSEYAAKQIGIFQGDVPAIIWALGIPDNASDETRRLILDAGDLWSRDTQKRLLTLPFDVYSYSGSWELAFKLRTWASPRYLPHHAEAVQEWLRNFGSPMRSMFASLWTRAAVESHAYH